MKRAFRLINGHNWAYLKFGKGRPIFLIHGFSNNADFFVKTAHLLQNKYEIIIPDLPGYGYTQPLKKNSFNKISNDLNLFIQSFNFPKVSLFGSSLGGSLCMLFAAKYPELTDILFIHNSPWRKKSISLYKPIKLGQKLLSAIPDKLLTKIKSSALDKFAYKTFMLLKPKNKSVLSENKNMFLKSIKLLSIRGNKELTESLMRIDLSEELKKIRAKSIVIIGEKDFLIHKNEMLKLAKILKSFKVVRYKKIGHDFIFSNPQKAAEIIRKYLK